MRKRTLIAEALEGRILTAAQVTSVTLPPAAEGDYKVLHENQGVEVTPATPVLLAGDYVEGIHVLGIGKVDAAPVYIPHVATNGGTHDIYLVATQDANLYKFDAHTGQLLGGTDLDYSDPGSGYTVKPVNGSETGNSGFVGTYSITGTPAVRPDGKVILVMEEEILGHGMTQFVWNLVVLDPSTLQPVVVNTFADTPVLADGTVPFFVGPTLPGTGGGSIPTSTGPQVPFDARVQFSRTAIQLDPSGLVASVGFGSNSGWYADRYHGYLLSFNTDTGQLVGTFNATPSATAGSEWGSGMPVTLDLADPGIVYATWGNGDTGLVNYSDSVTGLRLQGPLVTPNGYNELMTVLMVPPNYKYLQDNDLDEGSTQVTLVSPTEGITSGKSGNVFLFNTRTGQVDQTIVDGLPGGTFGDGTVVNTSDGTFVYFAFAGFNGQTTFTEGVGRLLIYKYDPTANRLSLYWANNDYPLDYSGATPTVSVPPDGNFADAIVWIAANTSKGRSLAAFRADNLQPIREFVAPGYSHFMPPVMNAYGQVALNAEDDGGGFSVWGPSSSFSTTPAKAATSAAALRPATTGASSAVVPWEAVSPPRERPKAVPHFAPAGLQFAPKPPSARPNQENPAKLLP